MFGRFLVGGKAPSLVPSFDPGTLPLSSWLSGARVPFTGLPWLGAASTGISGSVNEIKAGATDPVAGTGLNGIASIHYSTTPGNNTKLDKAGGLDVVDIMSATGYTVGGLARVNTTATPAVFPFLNGAFLEGDFNLGVVFTTSGLTVYHETVPTTTHIVVVSTGVWFYYFIRYNGTTLQIDINMVPGTPTAIATPTGLNVDAQTTSTGFTDSSKLNDWEFVERFTSLVVLTDADRDNYGSYLSDTYGPY